MVAIFILFILCYGIVLMCHNVLQIGAVCVGLWEGNCAKVLLPVCGGIVGEPVVIYLKPFLAWM